MSASKDKKDKRDLSLLPLPALEACAAALEFGAVKYGRYNYYQGHNNIDLIAAALRHIHQYNEGQDLDSESGIHHLGHAIANLSMILKELEIGTLRDKRAIALAKGIEADYTQERDKGYAYISFKSSRTKT